MQSNNIRLDLNSNVMFGTGKIVVSGAQAVFTVENGDMNEITVEAAEGAVTVGEDCGRIKAVRVTSTDAAVTIQSGFFKKLVLPATDTESLKNVKLSGGEFDSISFNGHRARWPSPTCWRQAMPSRTTRVQPPVRPAHRCPMA